MTKDQYFEMCEAMGSEPLDSEIPVDLEDLPLEAQSAWEIYQMLPSTYDSYSGKFTGKSLDQYLLFFELLNIEDSKLDIFKLVQTMDSIILGLQPKK